MKNAKFILYRLAKFQDDFNFAPDRISKLNLSDHFIAHELPVIIEELEQECGYHGRVVGD